MVMNKNIKIRRTIMREEVYDILRDWIMMGELEPGEKLRDQELSELLGISRTPVREALLKLEDDGFVVTKANRWTLVSPIDLKDAESIFPIVKTLESLAIKEGFERITNQDIETLERTNEEFKIEMEKENILETFQVDNKFHDKIVQSSNNYELSNILTNLRVKIRRLEIHFFCNSEESYIEHQKIIQALKEKDLASTLKAINLNWDNSLIRIRNKNRNN